MELVVPERVPGQALFAMAQVDELQDAGRRPQDDVGREIPVDEILAMKVLDHVAEFAERTRSVAFK